MSRGGSKINKGSFDYVRGERVSWLDEFANKIEKASKTAVEVARERSQVSLHDQITSIVSRQPAHATVEDLVKDYHQRTGLAEYLQAKTQMTSGKVASMTDHSEVFNDHPAICEKIKNFAKNKVDTSYGQVTVPGIQDEIMTQFCGDGLQSKDVENEKVSRFISNLIADAQKETPPADLSSVDLGKGVGVIDVDENDEANTDFYQAFMPNTD